MYIWTGTVKILQLVVSDQPKIDAGWFNHNPVGCYSKCWKRCMGALLYCAEKGWT
jgi:hypothetical protein